MLANLGEERLAWVNCLQNSPNHAFSENQLLDLCTDRATNFRPVRVGENNALARQNPAPEHGVSELNWSHFQLSWPNFEISY